MKTTALFISIILLSFVSLTQSKAEQRYMTVREFNKIHPEQIQLAKDFSAIVQKRGQRVDTTTSKALVRITFIYPGMQVSDYWRRSIGSFKKRMDEIGLRYELTEHFSKPAVEYRIQAKQMKNALKAKPDYLVFTLDAAKHKRVIERVITKGRPKLILQNITTPLRSWEGKQPFLYDGFDHATGSEVLANYYLKRTGGMGRYAVLFFAEGYVSDMRGKTFIEYMEQRSNLVLAASYYTDGNRQKSKRAALTILKEHPDIKFLYACSTDVALGAIDALEETGKIGQIMVNGWGGGSSELEAIKQGKMDVTIMRMNDDNGVAMAEAIRLDVEGKTEKIPTVYSGDFALVKKGISQQELEKLKARAFRYSGK